MRNALPRGGMWLSFHRHTILLTTLVSLSFSSFPALAVYEPENSWEQIQRHGTIALDRNEYWLAEPLLKKAAIEAGNYGYSDMRLAKSLGELGRLYAVRGRFEEAEAYLEEEFVVKQNALGKENGQIIQPMGSLIRFYLLHGTASKADPLTEDLLAFVEGKLRDPTPLTVSKMKLKKGEPLMGYAGTAAPIMRDPLIEWAITCDELGNIYKKLGNYDVADRMFKAALDLKSSVLGKEHLSLANSYDSLGEICQAKNELTEAESYLKDGLMTSERVLSLESPVVYGRLDKLAKCLIKEGKYQQAEELYQRALNFIKAEPSSCVYAPRTLYSLGCLYDDQKNYAAAAPLLEQALRLVEQSCGPDSADIVPYLQKYAYTLYYLGRKPEMEQLKARADGITNGTL